MFGLASKACERKKGLRHTLRQFIIRNRPPAHRYILFVTSFPFFSYRIRFLQCATKKYWTHAHKKRMNWIVLPCSRYWCRNKWVKMLAKLCTWNTWWTRYTSLRWNFPVFFVFWMHTMYTTIWEPYCRRVTLSTKMLTPCTLVRRSVAVDGFPSRLDSRTPATQLSPPIGLIQCLNGTTGANKTQIKCNPYTQQNEQNRQKKN